MLEGCGKSMDTTKLDFLAVSWIQACLPTIRSFVLHDVRRRPRQRAGCIRVHPSFRGNPWPFFQERYGIGHRSQLPSGATTSKLADELCSLIFKSQFVRFLGYTRSKIKFSVDLRNVGIYLYRFSCFLVLAWACGWLQNQVIWSIVCVFVYLFERLCS